MWIWVTMWIVTELLFFGMLTRAQFNDIMCNWEGRWEYVKFIPIRFAIWPFMLVAMTVEIVENIRDINHLHVWWFDEDSFKL